jgi:hypothetical protein
MGRTFTRTESRPTTKRFIGCDVVLVTAKTSGAVESLARRSVSSAPAGRREASLPAERGAASFRRIVATRLSGRRSGWAARDHELGHALGEGCGRSIS